MSNHRTGPSSTSQLRGSAVRSLLARHLAPFEALEPRRLFSGVDPYRFVSPLDALEFDQFVETVLAPGEGANLRFGTVVEALGDIDGDGRIDFAVSAPGSQDSEGHWSGDAGAVFIYSGLSKSLLRTISGDVAGFGSALRSLGDVNGDGVSDLAIGSPSADLNADATVDFTGSVTVYSGADGAIVWTRGGASRLDELGWAIALARDVNSDGVNDVFVGAPGAGGDASSTGPGAALVLSGVDGAIIRSFTGEANGDRFGHAVDAGIDVPINGGFGDGIFDFMVGAPENASGGASAGRAYAYNGADGAVSATFTGQAGEEAGSAVAMLNAGVTQQGNSFFYAIGMPGYANNAGRVDLRFVGQTDSNPPPTPVEAGARYGEHIYRIGFTPSADGSAAYVISAPLSETGNRSFIFHHNYYNSQANNALRRVSDASWIASVGDIDTDDFETDFVAGFAGESRATSVPVSLAWFPASVYVTATSANGRYMSLSGGINEFLPEPPRYVVYDGELRAAPTLANFPFGGRILALNNAGLFFGTTTPVNVAFGSLSEFFFYYQGQITTLADAITATVGRTPMSLALVSARLGENGDVLLSGPVGEGMDGTLTSFLFRGGVLTELTQFTAADVNSQGEIVGTWFSNELGHEQGFVIRADGVRVLLPDNFLPKRIDDLGVIYGVVRGDISADALAVCRDGVVTVLSNDVLPPDPMGHSLGWNVLDIDNAGRIYARFNFTTQGSQPPGSVSTLQYLYTPEEGLRRLSDIVSGYPEFIDHSDKLKALLSSGDLIVAGSFGLTPEAPATNQGGSPTSAGSGTGVTVTFINDEGDAVVFSRDALGYHGQTLTWDASFGDIDDVDTYADPRDGLEYAVVHTTSNMLIWFRRGSDGVFGEGQVLTPGGGGTAEPIVGPIATFYSADNRVHITGVSAEGDVLIYYQTNTAAPDALANWTWENLSQSHVRAQGQAVPAFVAGTELTPYVTNWGGMNIAGLNPAGEIEVVWWAPGQALWSSDNLTEESGGPALTGLLVSIVAPWGAMHLAGVTADGDLIATWWAPESNVWDDINLTAIFGGANLAPDSLTAYSTDWGGLNIAGIDVDTGAASVYWWTTNSGGWVAQTLTLDRPDTRLIGRLESQAQGTSLNIFGRTAEGELVRLFWFPSQGGEWNVETVETAPA
ncbi:MAG: FG-GAP repeat protein [Pyrinomonadaceae bacterium]|nr:FG-GAP repeat protein [Phycisphaerales bacterium]